MGALMEKLIAENDGLAATAELTSALLSPAAPATEFPVFAEGTVDGRGSRATTREQALGPLLGLVVRLSTVVQTAEQRRRFGGLRASNETDERGHRDHGENADDDDHDHELDEREALTLGHRSLNSLEHGTSLELRRRSRLGNAELRVSKQRSSGVIRGFATHGGAERPSRRPIRVTR